VFAAAGVEHAGHGAHVAIGVDPVVDAVVDGAEALLAVPVGDALRHCAGQVADRPAAAAVGGIRGVVGIAEPVVDGPVAVVVAAVADLHAAVGGRAGVLAAVGGVLVDVVPARLALRRDAMAGGCAAVAVGPRSAVTEAMDGGEVATVEARTAVVGVLGQLR